MKLFSAVFFRTTVVLLNTSSVLRTLSAPAGLAHASKLTGAINVSPIKFRSFSTNHRKLQEFKSQDWFAQLKQSSEILKRIGGELSKAAEVLNDSLKEEMLPDNKQNNNRNQEDNKSSGTRLLWLVILMDIAIFCAILAMVANDGNTRLEPKTSEVAIILALVTQERQKLKEKVKDSFSDRWALSFLSRGYCHQQRIDALTNLEQELITLLLHDTTRVTHRDLTFNIQHQLNDAYNCSPEETDKIFMRRLQRHIPGL